MGWGYTLLILVLVLIVPISLPLLLVLFLCWEDYKHAWHDWVAKQKRRFKRKKVMMERQYGPAPCYSCYKYKICVGRLDFGGVRFCRSCFPNSLLSRFLDSEEQEYILACLEVAETHFEQKPVIKAALGTDARDMYNRELHVRIERSTLDPSYNAFRQQMKGI